MQDAIEQRGLSAAQKSGEHRHRHLAAGIGSFHGSLDLGDLLLECLEPRVT